MNGRWQLGGSRSAVPARRRVVVVAFAVVVTLVGASFGSGVAAHQSGGAEANTPAPKPLAETEEMTVVYSAPIEAWANLILAQEFGEFEKENLEVNVEIATGPDGTLLVSQGEADVQAAGVSAAALNSIAQGRPLTYVANTFVKDAPEAGFWISKEYLKNNGEPDIEKLEGSRVIAGIGGGGFGNPGGLALWQWMQEVGLEDDDLTTANVTAPADAAAALVNDQVSISIGLTPNWSTIEESGCCELLVPTIVSGSFIANTDFLNDRPKVARAFFRALIRTNRTYLQGNYHQDEDVVTALADASQIPVDAITAQPSLEFSPNLALPVRKVIPDFQEQFRVFDLLAYPDDLPTPEFINRKAVKQALNGK